MEWRLVAKQPMLHVDRTDTRRALAMASLSVHLPCQRAETEPVGVWACRVPFHGE